MLASGASADEVWAVTWSAQGTGRVLITLANKTSSRGGGVGLTAGEQYIAALQPSPAGDQVLHFVKSDESVDDPSQGFFFCTPAQQERIGISLRRIRTRDRCLRAADLPNRRASRERLEARIPSSSA